MKRTLFAFGLAVAFAVPFSARAEQASANRPSGFMTMAPAGSARRKIGSAEDSFEAVRARVAADSSLTVRSLDDFGLSPAAAPRAFEKIEDVPAFDKEDEEQLVVPTIRPARDHRVGLLGASGRGAGGGDTGEYEVDALSGFFGKRMAAAEPTDRTGRMSTAPSATPSRPKPVAAPSATPSRPKPVAAPSATPSRPKPIAIAAPSATPSRPKPIAAPSATPSRPKPIAIAAPSATTPAPPPALREKKASPAHASAHGNSPSSKSSRPPIPRSTPGKRLQPSVLQADAKHVSGASNWPLSIGLFPPLQIVGSSCDVDPGIRFGILWTEHVDVSGLGVSGGVAWTTGDLSGIHVAGLYSRAEGDFSGLSFATFQNRVDGSGRGISLSAVSNVADTFSGLQLSLANVADELYGFQIGLYNEAGAAQGVQIGLFNSAGRMSGLQIGLSNYIDASAVPWLPVFNVSFSF